MPEASLFTAVMLFTTNFLPPYNVLFVQKIDRCFPINAFFGQLFQRSFSAFWDPEIYEIELKTTPLTQGSVGTNFVVFCRMIYLFIKWILAESKKTP